MNGEDVTVEQHGAHVGVVCLHRPPNNYFDTALVELLAGAYEELDGSGWCRAIVLTSEGRHFCAGLDFAANAGQDIAALYRKPRQILKRLSLRPTRHVRVGGQRPPPRHTGEGRCPSQK